ncbi:hypothetical protein JTB14_037060 [Gonioctena quinquepunctata]|nr:hypothetical protein JTB14_037060 [Gonioctena quinquepunctata]
MFRSNTEKSVAEQPNDQLTREDQPGEPPKYNDHCSTITTMRSCQTSTRTDTMGDSSRGDQTKDERGPRRGRHESAAT